MMRFSACGVALALVGCSGGKDTGQAAAEGAGLPEGASTWTGDFEVNGIIFQADASIDNQGGDLSGTVTFSDNPDSPLGFGAGTYTVTGTHEPTSGLVALAPEDWTEAPKYEIEMLGLYGLYDIDTGTIEGIVVDYATGSDNAMVGGAATMTVSGDGAPLAEGDRAQALTAGENTFTGTMQCSGGEREVEASLTYDGAGSVVGSLTYGDPGIADGSATFAFEGVHNPSTGGITLTPRLYTDPGLDYLTFFVEGTFDVDSGVYVGELRQNTMSCPEDKWQVSL